MEQDASRDEIANEPEWQDVTGSNFVDLVGPISAARMVDGVGRFRLKAASKHNNRRSVMHGGMIVTFADQAMGMTARQGDTATPQATVQLDVHFLDAVYEGETVEAACRVLRRTRMLVFMDAILSVGERTVATARGTWKILKPRTAS